MHSKQDSCSPEQKGHTATVRGLALVQAGEAGCAKAQVRVSRVHTGARKESKGQMRRGSGGGAQGPRGSKGPSTTTGFSLTAGVFQERTWETEVYHVP